MNESPPSELGLDEWCSHGGVRLGLPEGWREFASSEHLAFLVGPREPAEVMAPTCIVGEDPDPPDPLAWWAAFQTVSDGPLLLALEERDDGFEATYAIASGALSVTAHARLIGMPGRTLSVAVMFDSSHCERRLPVARDVVRSVSVRGVS